MTDREYLELAAKAAGLRVGFEPDGKERGRYDLYWSNVHHQLVWHGKSVGSEYPRPIFWNPLTDDGDALRLAVKCRISPMLAETPPGNPEASYCILLDTEPEWRTSEALHGDPFAATRRAIVRAAAQIGRSMT